MIQVAQINTSGTVHTCAPSMQRATVPEATLAPSDTSSLRTMS